MTITYNENIEVEKQMRQNMLKEFHLKNNETKAVLNRFLGKKDKPINFNDLILNFNVNEWIFVNDKVKFKLIYFNETTVIFDTVMDRNGDFGTHYHNDCREDVEVLEGVLFDSTTSKIFKKGETAVFEAMEKHTPIALEKCILKVTFNKE